LLFPGQGSQYPDMGAGLYAAEPTFRAEIDRCAKLLEPHLGDDIRNVLYPDEAGSAEAARRLRQTVVTQPAIFVMKRLRACFESSVAWATPWKAATESGSRAPVRSAPARSAGRMRRSRRSAFVRSMSASGLSARHFAHAARPLVNAFSWCSSATYPETTPASRTGGLLLLERDRRAGTRVGRGS